MPSKHVVISWNDDSPFGEGPVDPGYGAGRPPVDPGYGMGTYPHPGGGPIRLPVFPFDPTDPGYGQGHPMPPVPGGPPPQGPPARPDTGPIVPGKRYIVKWLACTGLILVPDNTLPSGPPPVVWPPPGGTTPVPEPK